MKLIKWFVFILLGSILLIGCASNNKTKRSKDDLVVMVKLADKYYDRGVLSSAEAEFRKILKHYPGYYDAWLKLGNIYTRTDQLEAAILAYDNCIAKKPTEMRCWSNLALARMKQSADALERGKKRMVEGSVEHQTLERFHQKILRIMSE